MSATLYMAPLQGVTTAVYRCVYAQYFSGYEYALAPFTKNHKCDSPKESSLRDILPERNRTSFILIPQVLSKSAAEIITLANRMHALGYPVVNWNLGCPLPKIRRKQRGSGLLPHPDQIVQILENVLPAIGNQLSLKVRLGSEDKLELSRLLPRLDAFPIKEIIIHPRTGRQMYGGQPDLDTFEECLKITGHKVVYNGDIKTVADYQKLSKRFSHIHDWMIGRGGITNPFLPELLKQMKPMTDGEKQSRFWAFQEALFEAYQRQLSGPGHLLDKIKEIWAYWAQAFSNKQEVLKGVTLARSIAQYRSAVAYIKKHPQWFQL